MGLPACPPATKVPGPMGWLRAHGWGAGRLRGSGPSSPLSVRVCEAPGVWEGKRASRLGLPPGWLPKSGATAGPPTPSPVDRAGCPWLDRQDTQILPPRRRGTLPPVLGRGWLSLSLACSTRRRSLSLRLTSTEKGSPPRPLRSQPGAGDWVGGGGLAQEQSCPQAAGQHVPGGCRRRRRGARRVREVWAAVRPQLPPGLARGPIAATWRRRRRRLPAPSPPRPRRRLNPSLPVSAPAPAARRSQVLGLDARAEQGRTRASLWLQALGCHRGRRRRNTGWTLWLNARSVPSPGHGGNCPSLPWSHTPACPPRPHPPGSLQPHLPPVLPPSITGKAVRRTSDNCCLCWYYSGAPQQQCAVCPIR